MSFSIKQVETKISKLEAEKNKAIEQKTSLEKEIDACDTKIKKLMALKKKYEQLEDDFTSALND